MSTIYQLDGTAVRNLHSFPLGKKQRLRSFYVSPDFAHWVTQVLPKLEGTKAWGGEVRPATQVSDLLKQFLSGEPFDHPEQFHVLRPMEDGIWELKTPDVRIFGWFVARDCFVANSGDDATRLKEHPEEYARHAAEAVNFRNGIDLDEPKFVPGKDPDLVIS